MKNLLSDVDPTGEAMLWVAAYFVAMHAAISSGSAIPKEFAKKAADAAIRDIKEKAAELEKSNGKK